MCTDSEVVMLLNIVCNTKHLWLALTLSNQYLHLLLLVTISKQNSRMMIRSTYYKLPKTRVTLAKTPVE